MLLILDRSSESKLFFLCEISFFTLFTHQRNQLCSQFFDVLKKRGGGLSNFSGFMQDLVADYMYCLWAQRFWSLFSYAAIFSDCSLSFYYKVKIVRSLSIRADSIFFILMMRSLLSASFLAHVPSISLILALSIVSQMSFCSSLSQSLRASSRNTMTSFSKYLMRSLAENIFSCYSDLRLISSSSFFIFLMCVLQAYRNSDSCFFMAISTLRSIASTDVLSAWQLSRTSLSMKESMVTAMRDSVFGKV